MEDQVPEHMKENEIRRQEWRKARMDALNSLPIDPDFELVEGLFMPFGRDVLIKEIKQGEVKTKSGIIAATPSTKTVGASIGVIMARGEDCFKPHYEGMKVYYEPSSTLRIYCKGIEYIQLPEDFVYGAAPPETYLQPYVADFIGRRREKRVDQQAKFLENSDKKLEEDFGKRDEQLRKEDRIQPIKK